METNSNTGEWGSRADDLLIRLDERINNLMAQIREFTLSVQNSLNDLKTDSIARDASLRTDIKVHVADIDMLKMKVARSEGALALVYLLLAVASVAAILFN